MRFCLILLTIGLSGWAAAQNPSDAQYWMKQIDFEQNRIDLMDGDIDDSLVIGNAEQNQLATALYLRGINQFQNSILNMNGPLQLQYSRAMFEYCKKIRYEQVIHLSAAQKQFQLMKALLSTDNDQKTLELLKHDVKSGIELIDVVNLKAFAKTYWVYAAKYYPTDVLNAFKNLAYTPIGSEVLLALCRIDPGAIKQFFGSNHMIDRAVKNSKDSVAMFIYQIYTTYGTQSKAYALLDPLLRKQMSLTEAEALSKKPREFVLYLMQLKKRPNIFAEYTVDKEIETYCMEKVVEINLRHEEQDEYRFQPIASDNAYEIYTAMVYCPQEIFTSTFLGMYKRMMEKKKEASGFEFLKAMNFNHFRVFVKQCAGYNKLDDFFSSMSPAEIEQLIKLFAGKLYDNGGDLGPAVDVADTYGSLNNEHFKTLFLNTIQAELKGCIANGNLHGQKLYGLLWQLCDGKAFVDLPFTFTIPDLDRVSHTALFPDGIHIQQHFFFDDEDGENAFKHWLTMYPSSIYKREDKETYVVFKSITGNKMEIYANKPAQEIEGRKALQSLFEQRKRFPDLIVHRGHSYYIENTLNQMTNSNKVAILGSCGGYQNISKAMENAFDVQIISTKQVGTLAVNTVLIQEITETIRSGKDLVWANIWQQVSLKLKDNIQFKDYIPPYKNLGARFIKAYDAL
ncbi:MAG: hypothetical protein RLZZ318_200 [Bacteroidota bacterium]|jgi:hypothetical protein